MTKKRFLALLTGMVATLAAASALAAPDRTGSTTLGGPPYTWDGGPISGAVLFAEVGDAIECEQPGKDCDDTLVNFAAGPAQVSINSTDPRSEDLDLYVYKSNAQGARGEFLKSSTSPDSEELVTIPTVSAGPHLIRVVPAAAAEGTYKGEAKQPTKYVPPEVDYGVDPADPGSGRAGGTGGGTTRANNVAPTTTARAPRNSQSRVLRGTARDRDGTVAYVDIALVRVLSRSCRGLTPRGTWRRLRKCSAPQFLRAKGTRSWRYTLRNRLAKGNYVLFARATDNFGRRDGGFGKSNRIRFRIR